MNYQKVYEIIINKAKSENRIRKTYYERQKINFNCQYYENHHILPRCLGGNNEKNNLVLLTAKEHFVAHKLLTYIYAGNRKIACAFHKMSFSKKHNELVSARDYSYARELISKIPMSDETKQKQRNYHPSEETKNKTSNTMILLRATSNPIWNKGKNKENNFIIKKSAETRSKTMKGRSLSEEHKKHKKEAQAKTPKILCKYCQRIINNSAGAYARYHGNNCKYKK